MTEARGNILGALCGGFERGNHARLGRGNAFVHLVLGRGEVTDLSCTLFQAGYGVEIIVSNQERRHQDQPRIADLAHAFQQFADFPVDMGGELAQVILLAVVAGDRIGAVVHHDIDERHHILPGTGALTAKRGTNLGNGAVEPAFYFFGNSGKGARFLFQLGDPGQKRLALLIEARNLSSALLRVIPRPDELRSQLLQPVERSHQTCRGCLKRRHTDLIVQIIANLGPGQKQGQRELLTERPSAPRGTGLFVGPPYQMKLSETATARDGQMAVRQLANAIRALSMDAVQAANSGHPGLPMGMADAATVLFSRFLKFDPADPQWPDRDRFVLSAGHGSMLLYALLHLTGYAGISLDDIRRFRQLGSPCAGHPEYGHAPGIETTTGPLGQGIANAVGMALAERMLNARFGDDLVDHRTYVIAGDGDLMEGISHEAASLAGHLKLNHLIVLFDDNHISIDGPTSLADSTDTRKRFEAMGWNTLACDGLDATDVARALQIAQTSDAPTLIACRTVIGFGAPTRAGTSKAHGEALGATEVAGARLALNWPYEPFVVPDDIRAAWLEIGMRGKPAHEAWRARRASVPADIAGAFDEALSLDVPASLAPALTGLKKRISAEKPAVATRKASEMALEVINAELRSTVGGSADLTGSNNTRTKGMEAVGPGNFAGRFIHYGIREHGMAAAMNGMALHGGVIPYSGTFLVFSDFCRPSIRLAALMGLRVIHVMTHDSIGLGEDGPTHQPVEHLASLRAIPNLLVFRPADAVETAECWELALAHTSRPSVFALTRQSVSTLRTAHTDENLSRRGAYELAPAASAAKVTLFATGSEVEIALAARELLMARDIGARVVSMPSWELFEEQPATYRDTVLGPGTVKVAIEAGSAFGWSRYLGPAGHFIGMQGFGASAPAKDLYAHFAITAEAAAQAAIAAVNGKN